MELLAETSGKRIWYCNVSPGTIPKLPFGGAPFVAIIWNDKDHWVDHSLIEHLIKGNCRYFVAGGKECDSWEDSADWAYLEQHGWDCPDETFLVTTAHKDETLEEVLWFGMNCTNFDDHNFENYLLVQTGAGYTKDELRLMCEHNYF